MIIALFKLSFIFYLMSSHHLMGSHPLIPEDRKFDGYKVQKERCNFHMAKSEAEIFESFFGHIMPMERLLLWYGVNSRVINKKTRRAVLGLIDREPSNFYHPEILGRRVAASTAQKEQTLILSNVSVKGEDVSAVVPTLLKAFDLYGGGRYKGDLMNGSSHHIIPRSRDRKYGDEGFVTEAPDNRINLPRGFHTRFHQVFGNMHPQEQLQQFFAVHMRILSDSTRFEVGQIIGLPARDFYKSRLVEKG